MFDRRLKSAVGIGAVVAALGVAAPLAVADPAPLFIPHAQKEMPRRGEGLSGADRSWLSPRQTTPQLATRMMRPDRAWLLAPS
jgi:hypothetical protein